VRRLGSVGGLPVLLHTAQHLVPHTLCPTQQRWMGRVACRSSERRPALLQAEDDRRASCRWVLRPYPASSCPVRPLGRCHATGMRLRREQLPERLQLLDALLSM
jgi:hypothetical protein